MAKVSETVGLMLTLLIASTAGKSVTTKMENHMTEAITRMIDNMTDSNGMRFMVSGIVRLCFHDCVVKCDGCIDMRRKFQPGNNGLELVMKSLRKLHGTRFKDFCSLADFISLSCVVATDYAAEKAEEEGVCTKGFFSFDNDCRPKIKMVWGRRTCEHAQKVEPFREPPDANQNPYEWFEEHFNFTAKHAACLMGSHSLGMLRGNETGFNGSYSMKPETLSNNYYKEMLNSLNTWKQVRLQSEIDNQTKTRFQWEAGADDVVRVNSDMMLIYKMRPTDSGRVTCQLPPKDGKPSLCRNHDNLSIIEELANDNKVFLQCFGEAMTEMLHIGYEKGELVPTNEEIPEPPQVTTTPAGRDKDKAKKRKERRQKKKERRQKSKVKQQRNRSTNTRNTFNSIFNRFIPNRTVLRLM